MLVLVEELHIHDLITTHYPCNLLPKRYTHPPLNFTHKGSFSKKQGWGQFNFQINQYI